MSNGAHIRFSVVIPAYNAAGTIVASVNSCLTQSYPPYEVIVVNDGSKDDTEKVLLQACGDKIKYISPRGGNKGASAARNAGIHAATGDYIAFHDADDTWHPDKLLRMKNELERNPAIRFIFHPYTLSPLNFNALSADYVLSPFPFRKLLLSNPVGTPCMVVWNGEKMYFNEQMRYMEDYDYALRAADKYGAHYFPAPLIQLHRPILSAGGLSSSRWKMRKGEILAYYHLAQRSPAYFFLLPFLVALALAKHVVKAFFAPRRNY